MRARADNRRLGLEPLGDVEHVAAERRVGPARIEIGEYPSGSLDTEHLHVGESGGRELSAEIVGPMEVCGREVVDSPGRVPVLPIVEIPIADLYETRIERQLAREAVECRSIARNCGDS